jgi:hypothetical protein
LFGKNGDSTVFCQHGHGNKVTYNHRRVAGIQLIAQKGEGN